MDKKRAMTWRDAIDQAPHGRDLITVLLPNGQIFYAAEWRDETLVVRSEDYFRFFHGG